MIIGICGLQIAFHSMRRKPMWRYLAVIVALISMTAPLYSALPIDEAQTPAIQRAAAPCIVHTSVEIGPSQFLKTDPHTQCSTSKNILKGPRVWVLFNKSEIAAVGDKPVLNFHAGRFDGFRLYEKFADGSMKETSLNADEGMRFDHQAADFRIPLGNAQGNPVAAALAVDAPYSNSIISRASLVSGTDDQSAKYLTLGSTLFLGAVLMLLLFNSIFYSILRERFLIWHQAMIVSAVIFVSVNSGIFFEYVPQVGVKFTAYLSQISLSSLSFASAIFTLHLIEPEKLTPRIKKLLQVCALWILIFTAVTILPIEAARPFAQKFYYMAFAPVLLILCLAMSSALRRGSRAARFQTIAWVPTMAAGGERIVRMTGLYQGPPWLDHIIYGAFAFEVIVSSLGVADRFMTIKRQRDKARDKAQVYAERSNTDVLTNLPNRRHFETVYAQNQDDGSYDQIAIADLDHFKSINDRFGHMIGDDVLRAFAREAVQHGHYIARIGGEEFVLLLDSNRTGNSLAALDELRVAITAAIKEQVPCIGASVTLSIGCAPIAPGIPMLSALELADKRLYQAKDAGRNRVVGGDSFVPELAA
ncbi:GGDEF domain-containing protein [Erythrobacter sp.]|nr:GGDEF domain-containing protein [Erythrobacter sp.]